MIKRVLGVLSYVGMALVFGALFIRMSDALSDWDQYATYLAWTGLALVALYTLGQWREIIEYFRAELLRALQQYLQGLNCLTLLRQKIFEQL